MPPDVNMFRMRKHEACVCRKKKRKIPNASVAVDVMSLVSFHTSRVERLR